ncbi:MBL fold metallo-hydrolase [Frankia sp. AiPs1]|uniref:MBL fold metallo-hydrolase n=1 Tax=Frankia sp. AiPs1 TaxID=573493 RepID=UPI0020445507|nr:MBL fold metallo-hydrolase [Frankia sp. AiPs1]MCM3924737.1 MBL fold metallo-hydrolase [Frankia sp. AiPs1]
MTTPRQVTPLAAVLLAPNPGPMTLDGTNTWLLRAAGEQGCVVVDPGPDHAGHLAAVAAAGRVELILLTHGHADHSAGAAALHRLTGAPVRALDPAHRLGSEGLTAGDVIATAGIELRVLPTPGHTSDSLSFLLSGDERPAPSPLADAADAADAAGSADLPAGPGVLTGDTILGRGTTVVAHPDGRLGDYLDSLRLLRELGETTVLPGHGPELPAAGRAAEHYLAHRRTRLDQVRRALADAGVDAAEADPADVVRRVYADTDRALWFAAELSVRAQLDYLREHPDIP